MKRIPEHLRHDKEYISLIARGAEAEELKTVATPLRPPFVEIPLTYSAYCKALDLFSDFSDFSDWDQSQMPDTESVVQALQEQYPFFSDENKREDVAYIAQTALNDLQEIDQIENLVSTPQ